VYVPEEVKVSRTPVVADTAEPVKDRFIIVFVPEVVQKTTFVAGVPKFTVTVPEVVYVEPGVLRAVVPL